MRRCKLNLEQCDLLRKRLVADCVRCVPLGFVQQGLVFRLLALGCFCITQQLGLFARKPGGLGAFVLL